MRVLGIDEAGRGCVLGALVVGAFVAEGPLDDVLLAAGVADSKALSRKRRDAARAQLDQLGTTDLREVTPAEIDAGNLNELEERVILDLIRAHRPDHVIIDALGHPRTLPALIARFRSQLGPNPPTIDCRPKADRDFPVCGAASLVAKTWRDDRLDELNAAHGPFGSGYPSDPKTRSWLAAHAASGAPWPDFVRTRWGTIRDLAQQRLA